MEFLKTLNIQIVQLEQQRDDLAKDFFRRHLSERLVFHRADGSVVGKGGVPGQKGFLESLDGPSPFSRREPEDIDVTPLGERAVVSLIVVGTRQDDGSVHRYRNIRFFTREGEDWLLDSWYNFEITGR
jgi:hypothetical protein